MSHTGSNSRIQIVGPRAGTTDPNYAHYLLGYQAADERPPRRDRVRCSHCGRWTRSWVIQGLTDWPDRDAVARLLCDHCAKSHRQVEA